MRWVALGFALVWAPAFTRTWGWQNFLSLCDVALILTIVGLWRWPALLLSTQAVASLGGNLLWAIDAGSRVLTGAHALGGTEYMWDQRFPLAVRLMSLFHLALPVLHVWALRRVGFDRRALAVQAVILAPLLVATRLFTPAAENINFVFSAPLLGRPLGPAPVHVALVYAVMLGALMLPAHLCLRRLLPASRPVPA